MEFVYAESSAIYRGPFLWFDRLYKESEALMDYIAHSVDPSKMYDEDTVLEPTLLIEGSADYPVTAGFV